MYLCYSTKLKKRLILPDFINFVEIVTVLIIKLFLACFCIISYVYCVKNIKKKTEMQESAYCPSFLKLNLPCNIRVLYEENDIYMTMYRQIFSWIQKNKVNSFKMAKLAYLNCLHLFKWPLTVKLICIKEGRNISEE